ncbi:Dolichyl-diphosphooligosaccharide--protein glycosyltransferase subunit DAD1-like protein [Drosera capensis]
MTNFELSLIAFEVGCRWCSVPSFPQLINLSHHDQVLYMAIVGSFPFNSFLSGVLSCTGTAVLAVCLRIQVNKENKEFKFHISPPVFRVLDLDIDGIPSIPRHP